MFFVVVVVKGDPKRYKLDELKHKPIIKQQNENLTNISNEFLKRNREEFRKSLVDIIMHDERKTSVRNDVDDVEIDVSLSEEPKNIEKDILRYYYYIHNGIDTDHVAPLENSSLQNVMRLIKERLRQNFPDSVATLSDEVKEDYLLSVKKAIVDFVLRDSREAEKAAEKAAPIKLPEHRAEIAVVPKPWHHSFEKARREITRNLHSINECMLQVLKLWYTSFNGLRMIDITEFQAQPTAIELTLFLNTCMKNIDHAKGQLSQK